jgi:hypothetical protein
MMTDAPLTGSLAPSGEAIYGQIAAGTMDPTLSGVAQFSYDASGHKLTIGGFSCLAQVTMAAGEIAALHLSNCTGVGAPLDGDYPSIILVGGGQMQTRGTGNGKCS